MGEQVLRVADAPEWPDRVLATRRKGRAAAHALRGSGPTVRGRGACAVEAFP